MFTGSAEIVTPWTAIAWVMTNLMAPMSIPKVIGPAPSFALSLPKAMKS